MDVHFTVFSIQNLLPSIKTFLIIVPYQLRFWQIQTYSFGKAE